MVVATEIRNEFILTTNVPSKHFSPGALSYLVNFIRIGGYGAHFFVVGPGDVAAEGSKRPSRREVQGVPNCSGSLLGIVQAAAVALGLIMDLPLGVLAIFVFVHLDAPDYVWNEVLIVDVTVKQMVGTIFIRVAAFSILADEVTSVLVQVRVCLDNVLSKIVGCVNAGCGVSGSTSVEAIDNLLHPACLQVASLGVLTDLRSVLEKASSGGVRVDILISSFHVGLDFDGFNHRFTMSPKRGLFACIKIEGVNDSSLNAFGNAAP